MDSFELRELAANPSDTMTANTLTHWDYTHLAATYDLRTDYNADLLREILQALDLDAQSWALEVGAGTGKLTQHLVENLSHVIAMEPNAAMRQKGSSKQSLARAKWIAGAGQSLPLKSGSMDLVAYGSSFNVLPVRIALDECARVLKPQGHWLALWNHRDLSDALQIAVEALIRRHLPEFDPGTRRESPAQTILDHGSFLPPKFFERRFVAEISSDDWLFAWQSHATLERQAGARLPSILADIRELVGTQKSLHVPYFTRVWTAQKK